MSSTGWPVCRRLIVASVFLFSCLSCASAPPALSTRPIQTESTWFVRLDASPDPDQVKPAQYDHPLDWAESDIAAVLGRLLVQQETGILGRHRSLEPLFSSDEVAELTTAFHAAFRQAKRQEWVSFAVLQPSGTNLIVTSGGLFFKDGHLHVVLANYRERIHQYAVDINLVRKNPLRSVRGVNGRLTFNPAQFVTETTTNWAGHSNEPASEIALDHRGVQTYVMQPTQSATTRTAEGTAVSGPPTSLRDTPVIGTPGVLAAPPGSESVQVLRDLSAQVRKLESQIEVLTRHIQEQDALLLKLRKDVDTLRAARNSKGLNQPPSR